MYSREDVAKFKKENQEVRLVYRSEHSPVSLVGKFISAGSKTFKFLQAEMEIGESLSLEYDQIIEIKRPQDSESIDNM